MMGGNMAIKNETCGMCHYWSNAARPHDANAIGECRRYAPQSILTENPYAIDKDRHAIWPFTQNMDYCGDWKKRRREGAPF